MSRRDEEIEAWVAENNPTMVDVYKTLDGLAGDLSVVAGKLYVHRRDTHGEDPFNDPQT